MESSHREAALDDQRLFLKVLEDLKNAINQPDVKPELTQSAAVPVAENTGRTQDLNTQTSQLSQESQQSASACKLEEPGTTTVTVSDKTKSRILQKLQIGNDKAQTSDGGISKQIVTNLALNVNKDPKQISQAPVIFLSHSAFANQLKQFGAIDASKVKPVGSGTILVNVKQIGKDGNAAQPKPLQIATSPAKSSSVHLFSCNFCDYYSDNKSYLKQHMDFVHNSDRPFKCPYCDYAGKRGHALREHLIVHTDSRPFQCKVCNATFRKKGHLTNHIKLHNSKRLVKCPLCKALVYDTGENGLDAHLKNDHDTERLYGCDLCEHVAASEPEILQHLNQNHKSNLQIYQCEACPFKTADNIAFRDHSKAHELANKNVQIDSRAPTGVIGVAAVSVSELQQGAIPATVKMISVGQPTVAPTAITTSSTTKTTGMMNPVWIKCSECGYVSQNSETVKKHMLEHIKDQYGESYAQQLSEKSEASKIINHPSRTSYDAGISKSPPKAPILVPVRNMNVKKNIGKIDMNSPILVPVTDQKLLQCLQSAASKSVSAVSSNTSITKSTVAGTFSTVPVSANITVSHSAGMEKIVKAPNLKVVPISHTGPGPMPTFTALPISLIPAQSTGTSQSVALSLPGKVVSEKNSNPTTTVQSTINMTSAQGIVLATVSSLGSKGFEVKIPKTVTEVLENEHHSEVAVDKNITSLQANMATVQKLIADQEKILSKTADAVAKMSQNQPPAKPEDNRIVYYLDSIDKHNTANKDTQAFTHDSTAGRFRCTICGYTCEFQRTIKAHIWKHSGNKQIDYPMFQNGPLSVYDDQIVVDMNKPFEENMSHSVVRTTDVPFSTAQLPPAIVYEETEVAEAKSASFYRKMLIRPLPTSESSPASANASRKPSLMSETYTEIRDPDLSEDPDSACSVGMQQNVVVETVESVSESYTAMQSQQNSPRVSARSPDSGLSEMTFTSTSVTMSSSSGIMSPSQSSIEFTVEDGEGKVVFTSKIGEKRPASTDDDANEDLSEKKLRIDEDHEDSAVTLLSLLKKGPNFNPACPPAKPKVPVSAAVFSDPSSPGCEDSSMSETDSAGTQRKPGTGISTSLLAVIEQLRERSKSDLEDEKLPQQGSKKQAKRRSRKNSNEDNTPAAGIENIEEFVKGGEVKYRCKLCHYTNESTQLLKQHMKLHKPKQQFECSLCDLIAESSEALQDHMIQHCKIRTYQCKLCSSMFNYKSQLRAHMRMHNDQDILLCDYCDFETRNATAFRLHTKNHFTKPPYLCSTCNMEFASSQSFRSHKRDGCVDKNASPSFKCDECEFTCIGKRELKNHQRIHMGKAVVQFPKKCPYCDYSETTIELIRKHISEVHGESKPLKCEMCGFVAVSIRSLKSHMKRHVNDQRFVAQPLEQYKCNLCGYVCHHLPSLKSHMWRHAADLHYSYEFTNDVINAAIDFDCLKGVSETNKEHVEQFRNLIIEKMEAKGLEATAENLDDSAKACCWVTFRCCQCGFETINKAELNLHMGAHTDVIKMTLEVSEDSASSRRQSQEEELDDAESDA